MSQEPVPLSIPCRHVGSFHGYALFRDLAPNLEAARFANRTVTVGKSKTEHGTGRPLPLNERAYQVLGMWSESFPERKPEPRHFQSWATIMGWSPSTTVRMSGRYGHIGQAAQREAAKALNGASSEADGAQNWAQFQATRTAILAN